MRSKNEEIMYRIIEYIDEYYLANDFVPTIQEIADMIGFNKGTISKYIQEMADKGMIDLTSGWRSIRTKKMNKVKNGTAYIPLVGVIACGTPILAEENVESYISITADFLGQGNFFALRARGNSMIGANIEDGDIVIVKQQDTAEIGEIIVALIDDEATLKRYFVDEEKRKIRLHPENPDLSDMYFDSIEIQGVVKKVIKDVR